MIKKRKTKAPHPKWNMPRDSYSAMSDIKISTRRWNSIFKKKKS